MGVIYTKLAAQDPDDLFAYSTAKIVKIRDRRLGLLRIALQIAILIYVIGFVIIKNKEYLDYEAPVGAVSTSIRPPSGVTIDPADHQYCTEFDGERSNDIIEVLDCQVWDEIGVRFPPDTLDSMFITTRVTRTLQRSNCAVGDPCLQPWIDEAEEFLFMPAIENYTIGLKHSFQARRFYIESGLDPQFSGNSANMTGQLVGTNGDVIEEFDATGSSLDIISVQQILSASGTVLADAHEIASSTEPESIRNAGAIMVFGIDYNVKGNDNKIYEYSVARTNGAEYKVLSHERVNATHRLSFNRHGIKLVFLQTGSISRFVFQYMLVQLFTGAGMLAIATVIVDLALCYLMPERIQYAQAKFQVTQDFSDVRQGNSDINPVQLAHISASSSGNINANDDSNARVKQ